MSENNIIRASLEKRKTGKTNWERIDRLSESDIAEAQKMKIWTRSNKED